MCPRYNARHVISYLCWRTIHYSVYIKIDGVLALLGVNGSLEAVGRKVIFEETCTTLVVVSLLFTQREDLQLYVTFTP